MESDILNELRARWNRLEHQIRQDPSRSALFAFGAGFLFSLVPVRRLLTLIVRLGLFALKPALLIMGAVKIYEYFSRQNAR